MSSSTGIWRVIDVSEEKEADDEVKEVHTMHTVPELVAQAGVVGLVTQREVLAGRVSVRSDAEDDSVHAILVGDHPVAIVKERSSSSRGDEVIMRERRALSSLGDSDLGPQLLADQPGGSLWVGVVRGVDLTSLQGSVPELAEVCETWGVAVARLHHLSTARAGVSNAPRPWVLESERRERAAQRVPRGSAQGEVLTMIESDPGLRAVASEVSARWTDRHWMHGDLTPGNVVVECAPPVRVRFLNFENAGLGDPAWDLATVVDSIGWMSGTWQTPAEPLVDYFLRGYRRAGGTGSLYPAIRAVRALATAWWLADGGAAAGVDRAIVRWWVDRARRLARGSSTRASAA